MVNIVLGDETNFEVFNLIKDDLNFMLDNYKLRTYETQIEYYDASPFGLTKTPIGEEITLYFSYIPLNDDKEEPWVKG